MAITSVIYLSGVTKFARKTFSSDLRKLTAVSESLSKSKIIYSIIEKCIRYKYKDSFNLREEIGTWSKYRGRNRCYR